MSPTGVPVYLSNNHASFRRCPTHPNTQHSPPDKHKCYLLRAWGQQLALQNSELTRVRHSTLSLSVFSVWLATRHHKFAQQHLFFLENWVGGCWKTLEAMTNMFPSPKWQVWPTQNVDVDMCVDLEPHRVGLSTRLKQFHTQFRNDLPLSTEIRPVHQIEGEACTAIFYKLLQKRKIFQKLRTDGWCSWVEFRRYEVMCWVCDDSEWLVVVMKNLKGRQPPPRQDECTTADAQ